MGVDERRLHRLLEIVGDLEFSTLKIEVDGVRVEIRQGELEPAKAESIPQHVDPLQREDDAPVPTRNGVSPDVAVVEAPMIGTFYRAPRPGEPPYADVGDRVEPDTVIGIIEVMKMMNSVTAGVSGVVTEVCASNGVVVEAGEPLLLVTPGDLETAT